MTIEARTPTRIDLAGGTLDIHPLYLFAGGGLTVNMAITLYSKVTIDRLQGTRVVLHSEDIGDTQEADHPSALALGGPLDLLARAVKFYLPNGGVRVTTRNLAPRGSGLGASSSLLMALSAALAAAGHHDYRLQDYIDWGANLEAQNLGIPTGKQDYYAAIYGGALAIHFEVKGGRVERLVLPPAFVKILEEQLVLSFTGISHFSGTSNWAMTKRYIDKAGDTVERLHRIKDTAHKMLKVLVAGDMDGFATALNEEWENRRGLADGVSTPSIDAMMAAATQAGALANKICGAGGGGCMITLAAPGRRQAVEQALTGAGARVLSYGLDPDGLQVKTHEVAPH
ncbi:MAG TPA: hypothetical protein VGO93_17675 [Candidatus Xenobia bacterium]|jgi:D-glycero-alpha-D-manno-heptose-7-phosphate kinase